MRIEFTKMHGIGNDYIYVNCMEKELENPSDIAVEMSKRRFSVGADGLVMICKSNVADAKMRMFNADGSEGKMCGNATRCVGKYLYDNKIVDKTEITLETLSGIKYISLKVENDIAISARVDMGIANFEPVAIPVISENPMINEPILINGREYKITTVSVGNPHAVTFVDQVDNIELEKIGPLFENNEIFPERVNTEFVKIIDNKTLQMRVWERGSGETLACGTGACAVAAAAIKNGHCNFNTEITVKLIGGDLKILIDSEYKIFMEGPATKVYEGVYEYEN